MNVKRISWRVGLLMLLPALAACGLGEQDETSALPPSSGQPLAFVTEVMRFEPTATFTPAPTPTPSPEPTATPDIPPTATPTPRPSDTPPAPTATFETIFEEATDAVASEATPVVPDSPPDPPRQGESWDMEDGFVAWNNPYGDDCSGAKVALGWNGFTSRGVYGSSCFVQNEYAPNVHSGRYSQEVTFDFVDSHAGLYRTFDTQAGHRYEIVAHLKHAPSIAPLQFHLGVDLEGGVNWESESVQWFPWDAPSADTWAATRETITATGSTMTVFIKGFHPAAEQGGATYIDNVSVTDLGR
ncbi:MAG: hypothetical protein ACE5H9_01805 [Anaerolineae bacterium]